MADGALYAPLNYSKKSPSSKDNSAADLVGHGEKRDM